MAALRLLRQSYLRILPSHFGRNFEIPNNSFISQSLSTDATREEFDVSTDEDTGIAILRMQKKPVNTLSLQTLMNLNIALEKLEQDRRYNGLIITSVIPKLFCAGLELTELNIRELWRALQEFWIKLYGSRLATVAAINGHCIAGGCLIALCCDHRVMASGPYKIGLNESQLGIEAPLWLMDTMVNTVGQRIGERALKLGELFLPDEALEIGLVDEVVPDSEVLESARHEMKKWLNVPGYARQLTKEALRKPTLERMIARKEESLDYIGNLLSMDVTQEVLRNYFNSLKKKT